MKTITSLAALVLSATLASTAFAQEKADDAAQPSDEAAQPTEDAAPTSEDAAAPAEDAAATDEAAAEPSDEEVELKEDQTVMPSGHDITPAEQMDGRWYNAEGIPTFKIEEDGTVDYATFSGFRRYHAECHVCHGPDGEGSTYAPALKNSVLRMDYYDYQEVVASGKQEVSSSSNQVMPAFGTNKNVWCYVDDIYVYLLARGTDSIPRGRPANKADKPDEFTAAEDSCMSM